MTNTKVHQEVTNTKSHQEVTTFILNTPSINPHFASSCLSFARYNTFRISLMLIWMAFHVVHFKQLELRGFQIGVYGR